MGTHIRYTQRRVATVEPVLQQWVRSPLHRGVLMATIAWAVIGYSATYPDVCSYWARTPHLTIQPVVQGVLGIAHTQTATKAIAEHKQEMTQTDDSDYDEFWMGLGNFIDKVSELHPEEDTPADNNNN